MSKPSRDSVCVLPRLSGVGGPAAFRARLADGLAARGVRMHDDPDDPSTAALLVIAGTRHAAAVARARRRGVRIVQRLNGMNWVHRVQFTSVKHFLRSEINNLLIAGIRRFLADRIVYQSGFSQEWWTRVFGPTAAPARVVYNGVDLTQFSPVGPERPPQDFVRLLMVEGHLDRAHELDLAVGVRLAQGLAEQLDRRVELMVLGDVPAAQRARWDAACPGLVRWGGVLPREAVAGVDRSAHVLYAAEINAACPNSVVEALACGLPAVAFDTGSLKELIAGEAGVVLPWGSDHWKMRPPVVGPLARAAAQVVREQALYRAGARARAEAEFGLERMVSGYLDALLG